MMTVEHQQIQKVNWHSSKSTWSSSTVAQQEKMPLASHYSIHMLVPILVTSWNPASC